MKKYFIKITAIFAVTALLSTMIVACGSGDSATDGQGNDAGEQVEQKTEATE